MIYMEKKADNLSDRVGSGGQWPTFRVGGRERKIHYFQYKEMAGQVTPLTRHILWCSNPTDVVIYLDIRV